MSTIQIPAARQVTPFARALEIARAVGVPAWAIAQEAGISESLVSQLSRGRVPATPETAVAIARALGGDPRALFPDVEIPGDPARGHISTPGS